MALNADRIDKSVPIPLYFQLKKIILNEIKNGTYPSGSPIPTENELSDIFKISRTTVRQAITELVQEGRLYRIKSKGTFVSKPKINNEDFITKIESFNSQMARRGLTASTEVLDLKVIPADVTVAKFLNLSENDQVLFLYRRRFANDEPLVTIKTYLPYSRCQDLINLDFTTISLYAELGKSDDTKIVKIQRQIEAVEADSEDARHLNMKKGKPIHFFTSIGYNLYGQPIEYSLARYRGDRNVFEITVAPE